MIKISEKRPFIAADLKDQEKRFAGKRERGSKSAEDSALKGFARRHKKG